MSQTTKILYSDLIQKQEETNKFDICTELNKVAGAIGEIPKDLQEKINKIQGYVDLAKHQKISEAQTKEMYDGLISIAEELATNPDVQKIMAGFQFLNKE